MVKDESGDMLINLDGILTTYAKMKAPEELLECAAKFAENGSSVFALLFSQVMSAFLTENRFAGLENQYFSYMLTLAQRNDPICILDFMKAVQVFDKKKIGEAEKTLLPHFFKKHHAILIKCRMIQGTTPQNMFEILRFLDILHAHLKRHYRSVFKISGPSTEAQSSSHCTDQFAFDENCNLILEMTYFWVIELQSHQPPAKVTKNEFEVLEQLKKKRNNEYISTVRNLCSSDVEMNLILTFHKLNCTKRHFGKDGYDELYDNILRALMSILNQLRTPREIATYGNIVEEFCQIDFADHSDLKTKEDWKKFLIEVFKNKKVLTYFSSRPQTFFKFSHMVCFPSGDPFAVITPESIWLGCTEVANRLFENKPTRRKFVLDILVPAGMNQTELGVSLIKKKLVSYMAHSQEYLRYWDAVLLMKSRSNPEVIIELFYFAFNRMLLTPEIMASLEPQCAKLWRSTVAKIFLNGLSHENLKSNNIGFMLNKELLLLVLAVSQGYFVEDQEDLFKAIFDSGMRWLANWDVVENRAHFKDNFHIFLNVISLAKMPPDSSGMREVVLRGFLDALRIKEPDDKSYFKAILSHWEGIVGTPLPPEFAEANNE